MVLKISSSPLWSRKSRRLHFGCKLLGMIILIAPAKVVAPLLLSHSAASTSIEKAARVFFWVTPSPPWSGKSPVSALVAKHAPSLPYSRKLRRLQFGHESLGVFASITKIAAEFYSRESLEVANVGREIHTIAIFRSGCIHLGPKGCEKSFLGRAISAWAWEVLLSPSQENCAATTLVAKVTQSPLQLVVGPLLCHFVIRSSSSASVAKVERVLFLGHAVSALV